MCFIDASKAFDRVNHEKDWRCNLNFLWTVHDILDMPLYLIYSSPYVFFYVFSMGHPCVWNKD